MARAWRDAVAPDAIAAVERFTADEGAPTTVPVGSYECHLVRFRHLFDMKAQLTCLSIGFCIDEGEHRGTFLCVEFLGTETEAVQDRVRSALKGLGIRFLNWTHLGRALREGQGAKAKVEVRYGEDAGLAVRLAERQR